MRGVKKSHLPEKNRIVCGVCGRSPVWRHHEWAFRWIGPESRGTRHRCRSASGRSVGGSTRRASESEPTVAL